MSFMQTVQRIASLAVELWHAQSTWILLAAGLFGFSYLFPYETANAIALVASLVQLALYVYWMKVGSEAGFSLEAFASREIDWLGNIGISLGIGLPFAVVFGLSAALLAFGPLGWLMVGFVWFVLLVLLELYSPPVAVRANGFRQALFLTISMLKKFKNRQALTSGAFWYPALLGLAASFLEVFVNPQGGFLSAIVAFALAVFQLPWYAAAQLVLYENVWAEGANREVEESKNIE